MTIVMKTMPAGSFKTHCLSVIDEVYDKHEEVVITKHGKPMAKLVPIAEEKKSILGSMRGQIKILGDIVEPITTPEELAEWENEWDELN